MTEHKSAVVVVSDAEVRAEVVAALTRDGVRVSVDAIPDEGKTDVLVVDAPVPAPRGFLGCDPEQWYTDVHHALSRPFRTIREAVPRLRASGDGRLIVLGAGWTATEVAQGTAAAAAHGGVVAMTKTLARDLGPMGISVNEVVTDAGAPVAPTHVAAAVAYLAGPRAGAMTGQLVTVGRGGHLRP